MRVGTEEWQQRQRHLDPAGVLGELARVRAGLDAGPGDHPRGASAATVCCWWYCSAAALAARALCLCGVLPIVRMLLRQRPISSRFKLVILWGGVRGAVTLAFWPWP